MPDRYEGHLDAAQGYLDLGMYLQAAEELDLIQAGFLADPDVLHALARVCCGTEAWQSLATAAGRLVIARPEDSQHWIWLAYATRRCVSIPAAEVILLDALQHHPAESVLHYNLACYAACTGRLDLARERLAESIRLEPGSAEMARQDPDLMPLW